MERAIDVDGMDLDYELDDDMIDNVEDTEFDEDDLDYDLDDDIVEDLNTEIDLEDTDEVDNEYGIITDDASFISDTGEIVVMDTRDDGDNFKLEYIDIENIAIVQRIRKNNNVDSLVKSIKSTGLLQPVTVAPTATEGLYVLIHGYRRLLACARAGIRIIPSIINTKVSTPEIPVLEALYNHNKRYSVSEIVDYIDYLEKQKGIMSASMIEYLLQMNSGDYTKLKDILNDDDPDIVDNMFNGTYTIEQAFKKLEQRRRKESAEEKELKKATKVYDDEEESGAEDIVGSGEEADESEQLTDEEIESLAINANHLDDDLGEASLDELVEEGKKIDGYESNKQDPKHRKRLDPALRNAVLARDKNTCQICKVISGQEYINVLDIHHIVPVYLGGSDVTENLMTACTVCHKLVHLYGRGELHIRPLENMTEEEQIKFKRIVKLGNIIRKGVAIRGLKKEQLKKMDNAETIGRRLKGSKDQIAD